jgi:acyl carrier protein
MATAKEIDRRFKQTLADQMGVSVDDLKPETSLVEDLNTDSLDLVEISMATEDEFAIEIPDEEIEKLGTVQQWCEFIAQRERS